MATPEISAEGVGKALAAAAAFFSLVLHTPSVKRRLARAEGGDRREGPSIVDLVREVDDVKAKATRMEGVAGEVDELRREVREDFRAVNLRLDAILLRLNK